MFIDWVCIQVYIMIDILRDEAKVTTEMLFRWEIIKIMIVINIW